MAKTGCNRASFLKDLAHEGSQTAIKELQPTECSLVSSLPELADKSIGMRIDRETLDNFLLKETRTVAEN
jgi:hypothetical protein